MTIPLPNPARFGAHYRFQGDLGAWMDKIDELKTASPDRRRDGNAFDFAALSAMHLKCFGLGGTRARYAVVTDENGDDHLARYRRDVAHYGQGFADRRWTGGWMA